MMKKSKYLILCVVLTAMAFFAVGCGTSGNKNGTEAPYEDETNRDVNDSQNKTKTNDSMYDNTTDKGGTVEGDLERSGDSLKDAGRNLMDSVEETGDALRDGINNLGNDMNDSDNMNRPDEKNNTDTTNNAGGMNMSR